MFKKYLPGSVAPLALLFTLVSMSFTAAYLKNSFSQTAMEKYRYAEWEALYAAEAGLNQVAVVVLPTISGDTTLLADGVDYGNNENDESIGRYKDIKCRAELMENSTRKRYVAEATGVAEYTTPNGNEVTIERTVYTSMVPRGFEDYMYFTDEEFPIGPGNTGTVNFGPNDQLEGRVHTNGQMVISNAAGCPQFTGVVNITHEAIEEYGSAITGGDCESSFLDEDGNSIIDTVSRLIFPPTNSAEVARAHATYVFSADDMLWRTGKKDTMIMTEINFVTGGFWATQWWYNIPPVGSPAAEYDFFWDSTGTGATTPDPGYTRFGLSNQFDLGSGEYETQYMLRLSTIDAEGNNIGDEINEMVSPGDQIRIQNATSSRVATFTVNIITGSDDVIIIFFNILSYYSVNLDGFNDDEPVTFINLDASTGLSDDVEWNSFYYYHDHVDGDGSYCEPGRIQHFDFEYWNYGGISGTNCDIFSCPDIIYNSEYVYRNRVFYPKGSTPKVIYIRDGQVLVRGTVDGQYSIVTDDYTEYRRHDDMDIIDRVWGNIWLIDDVVYEDSYSNGATIHPEDGGSANVLGLIAGGSVIIANTRPNGARGQQYGSDITINAAILAMHGGFISHYWQNTLLGYHDFNDGLQFGIIADGRGGHRNYYREQIGTGPDYSGVYTGTNDFRGDVNLWGSIVQFQRGYMLRNYIGPYNVTPGVGYDKNYHYDYNLQISPPPYYPDQQSVDNNVILKMASYGEVKKDDEE